MKRMMPCLLLLVLVVGTRAEDKNGEAKAKALHDSSTKVIGLMRGIKDKESAEKAKGDLEKALIDHQQKRKAFESLGEEELKKLKEIWETKFNALAKDFQSEGLRLQKTPGVMTVLADLGPFKQAREAKVNYTRTTVMNLDKAIAAYKLTTGDYPKTLTELSMSPGQGIKPFIPKEALKDAWDRPIKYDANGPRNKGTKPDIWSMGPPELQNALIGNWEAKK